MLVSGPTIFSVFYRFLHLYKDGHILYKMIATNAWIIIVIRQKILIILFQEIVYLNKYTKTFVQSNQSFHRQGKFHQLQKEFAKLVSNYVMMIPAMVTAEMRKMKVHTC